MFRKSNESSTTTTIDLSSMNNYSNYINSYVDEELYMNFAVNTVFDVVVKSFKGLEFGIYKKESNNSRNTYIKSTTPGATKLSKTIDTPNPLCNFSAIVESYLMSKYFVGTCLLRKVRGTFSDDLYVYNNNFFEVERDKLTLVISKIKIGNREFSGDELKDFKLVAEFNFRSRLQGTDEGIGRLKFVEPIKKIINGLIAHNIAILKNGGNLNGFMTVGNNGEDKISLKQQEETRKQFEQRYGGAGNSGKLGLFFGDVKYQATGTSPKDLDFMNSINEMQKIICRAMGVPEALIFSDNSSYNNTLEYKKYLYTETVIPLAKEFCEHLNYLFKDTLADNEEFYFSTADIKALQSSMAQEIDLLSKSLSGYVTINNFIAIVNDKYQLGLESLGVKGDVVLINSSQISLEDLNLDVPDIKNEVDDNE